MKRQEVENCIFSNWYNLFKLHTIKSKIIPLKSNFIKYLKDEGPLVLPSGFEIPHVDQQNICPVFSDDDDEWSDQEEIPDHSENVFPELLEQIKSAIEELGGKVFPKLNWSCPKDAKWMLSGNSIKCSTPGEIVILVKSSTFVAHDLIAAFELCDDKTEPTSQQLVLKKWRDIQPASEFRCFIKQRQLIAVSQRYHKHHYKYIDDEKELIAQQITQFVDDVIIPKFPSDNYVVDVFRSSQSKKGFEILDFNPFSIVTESLLFKWDELKSGNFDKFPSKVQLLNKDGVEFGEFRYANEDIKMQPSENLMFSIPEDLIDLSTGNDATKLVDFLRMKIQEEGEDSSDDEEWKLPEQH